VAGGGARRGQDTAEVCGESGGGEAGALDEFEGLAVGRELRFPARGLVAQWDGVLGVVVQREDEAIASGRLGGVDESVGEDGGELGLGARYKEKAGGDKDGSAGDGDGLG